MTSFHIGLYFVHEVFAGVLMIPSAGPQPIWCPKQDFNWCFQTLIHFSIILNTQSHMHARTHTKSNKAIKHVNWKNELKEELKENM